MLRASKYLLLFILLPSLIFGQETKKKTWKDVVEIRGYLKDMHILNVMNADSAIQDNFLHNRLNFRVYMNPKLTAGLELRTRFFYGETKKLNPFYSAAIDFDPGLVDASFNVYESEAFFLHAMIDRFWIDYTDDKWNIRIGRQRVNWGKNLVWNPNDLFNVYNFSDFDYEERPGSDGIKITRYLKNMKSLEFVYKKAEKFEDDVIALKYEFNHKTYDIQLIGAKFMEDIGLGLGWAGNLKNAGFKGELGYFQPYNQLDTAGSVNFSFSVDYTFKNSMYVNASALYNSAGITDVSQLTNPALFSNTMTAKNLMPNRFTYFAQTSGQFTPLFSGSFALIYAQGIDIVFAMPSLAYSLSESWDLMLAGQSYFGSLNGNFGMLGSGIFLRVKWSF